MKIGKVPTEVLKEIIFSNITHHREEVLVRPGVGEDCGVVDFGEYVCVLSSDPITGAAKDIGSLAIHISCNDVASNGVEPLGIMMTILAPVGTTKEDLLRVMTDANEAATSINVEIIGGHTEITDAVNRMIVSTTAIGKQPKVKMVSSKGAQVGDAVIMTKHGGLEGVSIIATDLYDILKDKIDEAVLERAITFGKDISVVKEGVLAGNLGIVNSMHDVTEGGILGALWELAEASELGIVVEGDAIPFMEETIEICSSLSIDPMRLISSGVMVMTVSQENKNQLLTTLREAGIDATEVATITEENRKIRLGGELVPLDPPREDELYKVI
ncbi:AIR synthase family protein [Alkaliphilus hydrothermalis]|uniref:Hydrogenase expression/formation protein HypE n=1 Tax=Alkaliphilus hydrothermalis TaxID=1482730 RepID=A0ABS2NQF0_9FIRM|nr:AIR synthase family protein [Alkaliphilus hydrothermalis]MBM7615163.1 hydrogenase expression/formation protein HypE [Alkaliphilus hydrothermalis]